MAVKALKCVRCGPAATEDWVDKLTIDLNGGNSSNPVAKYLVGEQIVCGTIQFETESEFENPHNCVACYSSCTACLSA